MYLKKITQCDYTEMTESDKIWKCFVYNLCVNEKVKVAIVEEELTLIDALSKIDQIRYNTIYDIE